MKKHQMLLSISVIVLLCIAAVESCETPNGLPGVCKALIRCPVLMTKYRTNKSDPLLSFSVCRPGPSVII